ncbi:MAG: toll/interleukin-1 receptor domain-containing protein [Candidatus Binatia bacterium]
MTETTTGKPARLFYSYSHKDEDLRNELEEQLALLKRQGLISGWHDRRIVPGQEWAAAIDENLEAADVILLLVSGISQLRLLLRQRDETRTRTQ